MRKTLAAAAAACLCVTVAGPAMAQDNGFDLTELPTLGFAISADEGVPGDLVGGDVSVADVEEHCLAIEELFNDNEEPTGELVRFEAAFGQYNADVNEGERPVPGGLTLEEYNEGIEPIVFLVLGVTLLDEDGSNLEQLWQNLFILTFADLTTTELIGDTANFSPTTGEGEIEVPELEPDIYGVAAACVNFVSDEELLAEDGALDQVVPTLYAWIQENYPEGPPALDPDDPDFVEFVVDAGGVWVPETVTPMAFGVSPFCVLDADGNCGDPEPEPVEPPAEEEVTPEPEPETVEVTATAAEPRFTG